MLVIIKEKPLLLDPEDLDLLELYTGAHWHRQGYLRVCEPKNGTRKFLLHRLVATRVFGDIGRTQVDHIDQNKANNCRSNLRLASRQGNSANRVKMANNTSGYKGVYWHKHRQRYQVSIGVDRERVYIGYFDCPIEAAKAYDLAALKYFGDYACLNFPEVSQKPLVALGLS